MRATKEQELVNVLVRERRRSAVLLGEASFPQLEAPGGPLGRTNRPVPSGAQGGPHVPPSNSSSAPDPQHGPSGTQWGRQRSASPQPWPSGTQGGRRDGQGPPTGPSGAQGGPRRPPPGFHDIFDFTADVDAEEDMEDTPATPSPNVSEDGSDDSEEMDTDNEEGLLAYTGQERHSDGLSEGFEYV